MASQFQKQPEKIQDFFTRQQLLMTQQRQISNEQITTVPKQFDAASTYFFPESVPIFALFTHEHTL